MILNFVLLALVFSAEKKKISPYGAAFLFGALKAVIYAVFTRNLVWASTVGVAYGVMAVGFVYFLKRIDRKEDSERPEVPTYTSAGSDTMKLKWEYAPLVLFFVLIVGGEFFLSLSQRLTNR
jgi:hypothetical protein